MANLTKEQRLAKEAEENRGRLYAIQRHRLSARQVRRNPWHGPSEPAKRRLQRSQIERPDFYFLRWKRYSKRRRQERLADFHQRKRLLRKEARHEPYP